ILAVVWAAIALVFWWGELSGRARRAIALVFSAAGVVFLVLALRTDGQIHSFTNGSLLLGPRYQSEVESVSARLPYYVMTVVCLLVGMVGLTLPERVS